MARALSRGAVHKVAHQGIDLYFFPEVELGELHESRQQQKITRGKETTNEAYKVIEDMISNLGWGIESSEKQEQANIGVNMKPYLAIVHALASRSIVIPKPIAIGSPIRSCSHMDICFKY